MLHEIHLTLRARTLKPTDLRACEYDKNSLRSSMRRKVSKIVSFHLPPRQFTWRRVCTSFYGCSLNLLLSVAVTASDFRLLSAHASSLLWFFCWAGSPCGLKLELSANYASLKCNDFILEGKIRWVPRAKAILENVSSYRCV